MSDEVDDVLDQYKVEGLDPHMLEGVIETPLSTVVSTASKDELQEQIEEAHKTVDEEEHGKPDPGPLNPVEPATLPQIAAQVGISAPDSSDIRKALANPAANDKLTEIIRNDDSTLTILNTVMEEIAEEAAFIKAWRNQNWDGKADISEATLSRIKMLSELVKAISEREKLKREKAVGKIDFHSENFQSVLKYFMSVIVETFRKVKVPQQYEDIFVTQLAKDFDGFEKKAEKIYYGKK
jgi:vesicle coat complex subunit